MLPREVKKMLLDSIGDALEREITKISVRGETDASFDEGAKSGFKAGLRCIRYGILVDMHDQPHVMTDEQDAILNKINDLLKVIELEESKPEPTPLADAAGTEHNGSPSECTVCNPKPEGAA